jgi:digeranylgeranylglycerophospholipid reductase
MKCDVLVVGAGPAGSSAAYASAKEGVETIFIDMKDEIGVPVSCSGAIGSYLISFIPFKIPDELLGYKIEGLEFFVDNISFKRKGGPWTSYAIDRSEFDKWLAERAQSAGAELLLRTSLVDLKFDVKHNVAKAIIKRNGRFEDVEFKVLVGADGVNSKVLEKIGKRKKSARVGKAVVFEYRGVRLESPKMDQVYFGDFTPGGYAHIFPLSKDSANVGVGSIAEEVDIQKCFEDFISLPNVQKQLKGAKRVKEKSGFVSFDQLSKRRQYGNVLLAGEAASQNIKPLVEGFLPSIICGEIAGKTTSRHILNGEPLELYQRDLDRKMGLIFRESDKLVASMEEISDLKDEKSFLLLCGLASNIFSIQDVSKLKNQGKGVIKNILVSRTKNSARTSFLNLSERTVVAYLWLRNLINSYIYKL